MRSTTPLTEGSVHDSNKILRHSSPRLLYASSLSLRSLSCLERKSAAVGTHHQAGQFDVAVSAGGSGPGHGTQFAGMAPQVFPSHDAAWTQDRQGCHGAQTGDSVVLDDAP